MTQTEAKNLVIIIGATFANSKFDTVKRKVYAEALEKLDQATTAQAISKLTLTSKFCPTVAEIYEVYQVIRKSEGRYTPTAKQSNAACPVCHGLGFLVKPRTVNLILYDYLYHCDCPAGALWSYDGSKISENRSHYYIPSIAEYHQEAKHPISA